MKIVVLGGGRVGSAMARDLARDPQFEVTVVDASEAALRRLEEPGLRTVRADLADPAAGGGPSASTTWWLGPFQASWASPT